MIKQFLMISALLASTGLCGMYPEKKRTRTEAETIAQRPPIIPNPAYNNALFEAIKAGDSSRASYAIAQGADCNATDRAWKTPLYYAAFHGHKDICCFLLENGASLDSVVGVIDCYSPLRAAIVNSDLAICELLVQFQHGNLWQEQALALALERYMDAVKNAQANAPKKLQICALLMNAGACLDEIRASLTAPPFIYTVIEKDLLDLCTVLVSHGINVNVPDGNILNKSTPLHLAVLKRNAEICTLLLSNGADIEGRAHKERTPLHRAANAGDPTICQLLLQHKASVNAVDEDGNTPLHLALLEYLNEDSPSTSETYTLLLKNRADVNAKNHQGQTPFHLAATDRLGYDEERCWKVLLRYRADIHVQDAKGRTPLHFAVARKKLVEEEEDEEEDPEYDYGNDGDSELTQELIARGANIHATDSKGRTPLFKTAKQHQVAIAKLLIEAGANSKAADNDGDTPLHLFARANYLSYNNPKGGMVDFFIYYLIANGASATARNRFGDTPLHIAAHQYRRFGGDTHEISTVLLELGAQVNALNNRGNTPFHYALSHEEDTPLSKTLNTLFQKFVMLGGFVLPPRGASNSLTDKSAITALCLFRRLGIPKDACYIIFTSISEMRNDFINLLISHLRNDQNCVTLLKVPTQFKPVLCKMIYQHTLAEMRKRITAHIKDGKHALLKNALEGDRTYYFRIAQQLGMTAAPLPTNLAERPVQSVLHT